MPAKFAIRPHRVFYDGKCAICQRSRRLLRRMNHQPPLIFIDINDEVKLAQWPQIARLDVQSKITVLSPGGTIHQGYDAIVELLEAKSPLIDRMSPLVESRLARRVGAAIYNLVARNRYGIAGLLNLEGGRTS